MKVDKLPHLIFSKGTRQRRRVGETEFANPSSYAPFEVSEEQRQHYFDRGWVYLHNVLPPNLLARLRANLLEDSGASLWPWSINGAFMYDELLDFYLFSPLGSIASQLFGGVAVYLWSDFRYFREPGQLISPWHYDGGECLNFNAPANMTAESKIRLWVTLDDYAPGPKLVDQGIYSSGFFAEDDLRRYWAGRLPQEPPSIFAGKEIFDRFMNLSKNHTVEFPAVRLGDVLVHSPCLFHHSPEMRGSRMVGFLCPTYHPAESRVFFAPASPEMAMRQCRSGVRVGEQAVNSSCFPRAYPPLEELRHGTLDVEYGSSFRAADWSHWLVGFVGRKFQDLDYWDVLLHERGPGHRRPLYVALRWATKRLEPIFHVVFPTWYRA